VFLLADGEVDEWLERHNAPPSFQVMLQEVEEFVAQFPDNPLSTKLVETVQNFCLHELEFKKWFLERKDHLLADKSIDEKEDAFRGYFQSRVARDTQAVGEAVEKVLRTEEGKEGGQAGPDWHAPSWDEQEAAHRAAKEALKKIGRDLPEINVDDAGIAEFRDAFQHAQAYGLARAQAEQAAQEAENARAAAAGEEPQHIVFTYIPPWAMAQAEHAAHVEGEEEEEAQEVMRQFADASFTDMGLYEAHAGD
jgi:hypothetical protein